MVVNKNSFHPFQYEEDPFSGIPTQSIEAASPEEKQFAKILGEGMTDFFTRMGALKIAIPSLVATLSMGVGKAYNLKYEDAWKNFKGMSPGYEQRQRSNMFNLRMKTSIFPATVAEMIVKMTGGSAIDLAVSYAIVSTLAMGDGSSRFHAVGRKYDFVDKDGKGVNLFELTRKKFFELCNNGLNTNSAERTARFGEKEWQELQDRKKIFKENTPHRVAMMFCRNSLFSMRTYVPFLMANKIVDVYGKQIQEEAGINKNLAVITLASGFSSAFALASTPFDIATTFLSSGKETYKQVYTKLLNDVTKSNLKPWFSGGITRMAFCEIAGAAIAMPTFARWLYKNVGESLGIDEKDRIQDVKNNDFSLTKFFGVKSSEDDKIAQINKRTKISCEEYGKMLQGITENYQKEVGSNEVVNPQDFLKVTKKYCREFEKGIIINNISPESNLTQAKGLKVKNNSREL